MDNRERDETIRTIAKRFLRLETLEERRSDSLDFQEHGVWQVRKALEAAYDAGFKAAGGGTGPLRITEKQACEVLHRFIDECDGDILAALYEHCFAKVVTALHVDDGEQVWIEFDEDPSIDGKEHLPPDYAPRI